MQFKITVEKRYDGFEYGVWQKGLFTWVYRTSHRTSDEAVAWVERALYKDPNFPKYFPPKSPTLWDKFLLYWFGE